MLNRMSRHTAAAMLVAAAVVASASCTRQAPRSHVVLMKDITFQPAELTVSPGDTLVWENKDFVPHTATARDASWDSKTLNADSSWRYVAEKPGRYDYYCIFHPTMRGTIEVR
jgi:plastocyanin